MINNINVKLLGMLFGTKEFESCYCSDRGQKNSLFAYVPETSVIPTEHDKDCELCGRIGIIKVEATGAYLSCPNNKDFEEILMLRYVRDFSIEKDIMNALKITISTYKDTTCEKVTTYSYHFFQHNWNEKDALFGNSQRVPKIQVEELGQFCKVFIPKDGWPKDVSPSGDQIKEKLKKIYSERYNSFLSKKNTNRY